MPSQAHISVLSSLLVRLAMVAFTMAVIFWIGWTIPAGEQLKSQGAQRLTEADSSGQSVPAPTRQAPPMPDPPRSANEVPPPRLPAALDVNQATEQDFERLPGIGPVLARRIVEYREMRGSFEDVEQLRRVKGIGKKTFERIRRLVAVMPQVVKPARKTA
ncbi:MAG TPA: helix-hairpin-helix domain-containing protein [Nitrospira sp.]|nr:helix-hairpin-helix domain-containing protein [Nitrospira sp.]